MRGISGLIHNKWTLANLGKISCTWIYVGLHWLYYENLQSLNFQWWWGPLLIWVNMYCIFNINITTWTNIIACLTWFWLFAKILPKHKHHGDGQGQHRILGNLSWHKTFFPTNNAIKKSLLKYYHLLNIFKKRFWI